MNFKEQIVEYLKSKDITVKKVEQENEDESIVCHISKNNNNKIDNIKKEMEEKFNVAILLSDSYNMNVLIVESNNLE